MPSVAVRCPQCGSDEGIKTGKTDTGGQRYRGRNAVCAQGSFLLEYRYQGYLPRVKRQIVDMALNGSGIRDTARVLGISGTAERLGVRPPWTALRRDRRDGTAGRIWNRACR